MDEGLGDESLIFPPLSISKDFSTFISAVENTEVYFTDEFDESLFNYLVSLRLHDRAAGKESQNDNGVENDDNEDIGDENNNDIIMTMPVKLKHLMPRIFLAGIKLMLWLEHSLV